MQGRYGLATAWCGVGASKKQRGSLCGGSVCVILLSHDTCWVGEDDRLHLGVTCNGGGAGTHVALPHAHVARKLPPKCRPASPAIQDTHRWLEVGRLEKAEEEFVDKLQVWPCCLKCWLVFFRVKLGGVRVLRWRECAEKVDGEHVHDFGVHVFGDNLAVVGDVVNQLVERSPLDFLRLELAQRFGEIEQRAALSDLASVARTRTYTRVVSVVFWRARTKVGSKRRRKYRQATGSHWLFGTRTIQPPGNPSRCTHLFDEQRGAFFRWCVFDV